MSEPVKDLSQTVKPVGPISAMMIGSAQSGMAVRTKVKTGKAADVVVDSNSEGAREWAGRMS